MWKQALRVKAGYRAVSILTLVAVLMYLPGCPPPQPPLGEPILQHPVGSSEDWAKLLASAGASTALSQLLKAGGVPGADVVAKNFVGLIMGKLFDSGPTPEDLILQGLEEIQSALTDIENGLSAISGQLSKLELALDLDTAFLDSEIRTAEMDRYAISINTLWNAYIALHRPDDTWETDENKLTGLADDILDLNNGAFPQLVAIHDLLTHEGNVSTGTLEVMKNYAVKLTLESDVPIFSAYMMIENYFGAMLQAQTRGATLMMEALRYYDVNTEAANRKAFTGDAAWFTEWYRLHIADQVECYLRQTESFVAETAYPQQAMYDFAPDAEKIFWRADLTAAWLSARHLPDDEQDLTSDDARRLFVYRVIGGPGRVAKYGMGWGSVSSASYDQEGNDAYYDVPSYTVATHHAYDGLRSGCSPYVQFMPPINNDGGVLQKGVISDATEIWTGKYLCQIEEPDAYPTTWPYYLGDIPGHTSGSVTFRQFNSAGMAPGEGEAAISYAHLIDIQHPPANLMGVWSLYFDHFEHDNLDHNPTVGWLGSSIPGVQWTALSMVAWPSIQERSLSTGLETLGGWAHFSYSLGVQYYWESDRPMTMLHLSFPTTFKWTVNNDGATAHRSCGLYLTANAISISTNYTTVGSGTDTLTPEVDLPVPFSSLVMSSLGAHMFVNWENVLATPRGWHHWDASYTATLDDLTITIRQ